jgi:hypothetical protein
MACLDRNGTLPLNCTSEPIVILPVDPFIFPVDSAGAKGDQENQNKSLFVTSDASIVLVIVMFVVFFVAM